MDARQMEFVVAIAEESSFTRAAKKCHIVQSALSHQIARLESELGVKLFERTSRSVQLSEAGQTLLPFARQVVNNMAEARSAIDALSGLTRGQLRIGMTQTAARRLNFISLAGSFHRRYPEVQLSTLTGPGCELLEAVVDNRLDLALAAVDTVPAPASILFHPVIEREPLVAIVSTSHPLAERKRVSLRELAAEGSFVEFLEKTALRNHVDAAFAAAEVKRNSGFEVGQIRDMVHYAANGLGVAIVPAVFSQSGASEESSIPSFRLLRLTNAGLSLRLGAYRKDTHSSTAMVAFLEMLDASVS
jgi:DNA-binding transcriptional LysR family regulator